MAALRGADAAREGERVGDRSGAGAYETTANTQERQDCPVTGTMWRSPPEDAQDCR